MLHIFRHLYLLIIIKKKRKKRYMLVYLGVAEVGILKYFKR